MMIVVLSAVAVLAGVERFWGWPEWATLNNHGALSEGGMKLNATPLE